MAFKIGIECFKDKEFNSENTYKFLSYIENTRKISKANICKYIEVLNIICNYALSHNEILKNFIENMDLKIYKQAKNKIRYRFLNKEEYQNLMEIANKDYQDIVDYIYFAKNTGLRLNEQLQLTSDRIDSIENTIYIDKTKTDKPRRLKLLDKKLIAILKAKEHLEQPFKIAEETCTINEKN